MSGRISGGTALAAVIGDPIAHSLSPALHNAAYEAMGFDGVFVAFAVRAGAAGAALSGARELGLIGLSVTTPHKSEIAQNADQLSATVARIGAANCVTFAGGVSLAHSTDGEGLLEDLQMNAAFDPDGARCVVLGAGGAARAIVLALAEAGASSITVVNRTEHSATAAASLAGGVGRVGTLAEAGDAALVVNATSLSLDPSKIAEADLLSAHVGPGQLVVDLVYRPSPTPFLDAAARRGASVRGGLGMLVHQAAIAVRLHTGEEAPLDAMWSAVASEGPGTRPGGL